AMHTMAPTPNAMGEYMSPVQPSATNSRHVRIRVAMVMPEIGFDEVPIRPVMRDDTVAKKNPKTRISIAATTLPYVGRPGTTVRNTARNREPPSTTLIGMSSSVRSLVPPSGPDLKSRKLSRADDTMVGMVRPSVMRPDASTAPAPMYRM